MKYRGKRETHNDNKAQVYMFEMGQHEVVILRDMLYHYRKQIPPSFFSHALLARSNAMLVELNSTVIAEKLGQYKRVAGGWHPTADVGTLKEVL